MKTTTTTFTPYRISKRPVGDFAVQRFHAGRLQRWGLYFERTEAQKALRLANAAACLEAADAMKEAA